MSSAYICDEVALSRSEMRRHKLLATARKLAIENGFRATGIARIASQSGIAVGQIYRDFSSKEDIVFALVTEYCFRSIAADTLHKAIAADNKADVLAWLLKFVATLDDVESNRMFAEIVAEAARNPRVARIFAAFQSQLHSELLNAIALLVPSGSNSDTLALIADTIMTFSIGLLNYRLFRPDLQMAPLVKALQSIISHQLESLNRVPYPIAKAPETLRSRLWSKV